MNEEIKNDLKLGRSLFLYQRSNCLVVWLEEFVFVNLRRREFFVGDLNFLRGAFQCCNTGGRSACE